jgi:hypothetical protein
MERDHQHDQAPSEEREHPAGGGEPERPADAAATPPVESETPAPEPAPGSGSESASEPTGEAEASPEVPGREWGYVDEEGRVHQKGAERLEARVVGQIKGLNERQVFSFLVDRFRGLDRRAAALESQIEKSDNKGRFSERVARLIEQVRTADALGDFDDLLGRLERMRDEVAAYQEVQRQRKEELCARAEEHRESTDWTRSGDALKALQREWKQLGSAAREVDDELWKRFRGVMDEFFSRRDEARGDVAEQRKEARRRKEELCARAEELAESTDWAATTQAQRELMEAWKAAGWAGRKADDELWARFRAARSQFFDRQRESREQLRQQREEHRERKDALCEAAETLFESQDIFGACEQAKLLQAEWKTIGPVPRAVSQAQWQRFRSACDRLFDRAGEERRRQRSASHQRQQDTIDRRREQAESLRESIVRDVGHVERWRKALEGLGDEGSTMSSQLAEKIEGVEERLAEKRERLATLEEEIRRER